MAAVLLVLVLAVSMYQLGRPDPQRQRVEYSGSYQVTYLGGSNPRLAALCEQMGTGAEPVPHWRYEVITLQWAPTGTARLGADCEWSAFVLHAGEWSWSGHMPADWSGGGSAAAEATMTRYLGVQVPTEGLSTGSAYSIPAGLATPLTVVYSVQPPRTHPQLRVALVATCGEEPMGGRWLSPADT